jgi:hypothetical protein
VELGAVKATLALALPAVAVPMVGAPGTVTVVVVEPGVTEAEPEDALVPLVLVAVTVQLYVEPLVKLDTVSGLVVPEAVLVVELVTHEAVYFVIADPPVELGALKVTLALVLLADVAVPIVGAPGTVAGVTDTALEEVLLPALLVALTVQL